MNYKTLLTLPVALALGAPIPAGAYVGFRLNFAVPLPLFYPSAGYYAPAPVYARPVAYDSVPGTPQEHLTPAPGPGYVWMAGHWNNVAQRWVWVTGHWEMPPSPSASWVAGHWVQGSSGWVWAEGTWTIASPSQQSQNPPAAPAGPPGPPPGAPDEPPAPPPGAAIASPASPAPAVPEMDDGSVVAYEPPAPIAEYVPAAPYPDYVWVGGFWGWRGAWVWNAGHYSHRPFHGAAWVSGGWSRGPRGWAWHRGRWH